MSLWTTLFRAGIGAHGENLSKVPTQGRLTGLRSPCESVFVAFHLAFVAEIKVKFLLCLQLGVVDLLLVSRWPLRSFVQLHPNRNPSFAILDAGTAAAVRS